MRILPEETGAVVIDMQEKLMSAMHETKACEEKAAMLLKGLQVLSVPTVIVQQYTKGLGNTLPSLYEAAGTTEYCEKASFSCCRNKAILDKLEAMGKKNMLVMGTEAHICVLQSCMDLKAAGFQPVMVVDAVASRREEDKKIAIERAIQEGILVTTAEAVLFELTLDSTNPCFKAISDLNYFGFLSADFLSADFFINFFNFLRVPLLISCSIRSASAIAVCSSTSRISVRKR